MYGLAFAVVVFLLLPAVYSNLADFLVDTVTKYHERQKNCRRAFIQCELRFKCESAMRHQHRKKIRGIIIIINSCVNSYIRIPDAPSLYPPTD